DIRLLHQIDKRNIGKRLQKQHVWLPLKEPLYRILHIWIRMNGVDDLIVAPARQTSQCATDALETGTEAFAPMCRDQHQLLRSRREAPVYAGQFSCFQAFTYAQY